MAGGAGLSGGLAVRRAETRGDVEAAVRVIAEVAEEGWLATEPPVDVAARVDRLWAQLETDGPDALWLLRDAGRVVGCTGLHSTGIDGVAYLGMAVIRTHRGRGGGRMMLAALLEHARKEGLRKVELEVFPGNAPAIAFFLATGFEIEGLRRERYPRRDGSVRSSVMMAMLL